MLTAGPTPNYWRARVDNDQGVDNNWEQANKNMQVSIFKVEPAADGKTVTVNVELNLPNVSNSKQTMQYVVYGSGEIYVNAELTPAAGPGEMLKYGAELTLPKGFENVFWYGAGPQETYQDRKQGAHIGEYTTTVTDSFFSYLTPQSTGNHVDVRYIALEDESKPMGIMVVSEDVMEASALHFSTSELSGKAHTYNIPQNNHTILNIDLISRGLGGASCGPQPLSKYLMTNVKDYSYSYTIVPYIKDSTDLMELSKVYRDADSFSKDAYDQEEADKVDDLINRVNNVLHDGQRADVEAARATYDSLTDDQKALVKNTEVLLEAEAKVADIAGLKAFARDQSGNGLDAEIQNSAIILKDETSPTGYAMEGYFSIPNKALFNQNISGTNAFSMEVWVNSKDFNSNNVFIAKGDTQASLQAKDGGLEFFIHDGGGWYGINPRNVSGLTVNEWHHVVGTYDGATLKLYLDGALIDSSTINKSVGTNDYDMAVGICLEHTDRKLRGKIGAARMYTTALSESEINNRYRADMGVNVAAIESNADNVLFWYDFSDAYTEVGDENPTPSPSPTPTPTPSPTEGPTEGLTEGPTDSNTSGEPTQGASDPSGSDNPKTGDYASLIFVPIVLFLSCGAVLVMIRRKKFAGR